MSSFEGQWGLCMEEQEGCRKQTLLFKGTHKISVLCDPAQKQSFERNLGQAHLLILEKPPREAAGTPHGDTGGSHFGSWFYH